MAWVATGIAIAGVAVSAGGAIMQGQGQDAAARSSYKSAQAQGKSAVEGYMLAMHTIDEQQRQLNIQTVDEMNIIRRQTDNLMAQLAVAAGAGGVRGISVNAVVHEPDFAAGHDIATLEQNRLFKMRQSQLEKMQLKSQAQSGINVAQSQVQPGNNWAGTALSITGSALGTAGQVYGYMNPPTK